MTPAETLAAKPYPLDQTSRALEELTPVMYAAKYGLNEYLEQTLNALDPDTKNQVLAAKNKGGNLTPLHFSARYGRVETTDLLLQHGASPLIPSTLMQLPLHSAFNQDGTPEHIKAIYLSLTRGYPQTLSIPNSDGNTVAHLAAELGLIEVLEDIQSRDNKVLNKKNNDGQCPLLFASQTNQKEAVLYLLNVIDQPVKDNQLRTPLHYAVLYGSSELVETLIPYLNVTDRDINGYTALDYAVQKYQADKIKILTSIDNAPSANP